MIPREFKNYKEKTNMAWSSVHAVRSWQTVVQLNGIETLHQHWASLTTLAAYPELSEIFLPRSDRRWHAEKPIIFIIIIIIIIIIMIVWSLKVIHFGCTFTLDSVITALFICDQRVVSCARMWRIDTEQMLRSWKRPLTCYGSSTHTARRLLMIRGQLNLLLQLTWLMCVSVCVYISFMSIGCMYHEYDWWTGDVDIKWRRRHFFFTDLDSQSPNSWRSEVWAGG